MTCRYRNKTFLAGFATLIVVPFAVNNIASANNYVSRTAGQSTHETFGTHGPVTPNNNSYAIKSAQAESRGSINGKSVFSAVSSPPNINPIDECQAGQHKYVYTNTDGAGEGSVYGPTKMRISVGPLPGKDYGNFEQQPIVERKTAYGDYLEQNRGLIAKMVADRKNGGLAEQSEYRRNWEKFLKGAKEAAAKDRQLVPIQVSAKNQKALSIGGVLHVQENTQYASVTSTHYQDKYDRYDCLPTTGVFQTLYGVSWQVPIQIPIYEGGTTGPTPDGDNGQEAANKALKNGKNKVKQSQNRTLPKTSATLPKGFFDNASAAISSAFNGNFTGKGGAGFYIDRALNSLFGGVIMPDNIAKANKIIGWQTIWVTHYGTEVMSDSFQTMIWQKVSSGQIIDGNFTDKNVQVILSDGGIFRPTRSHQIMGVRCQLGAYHTEKSPVTENGISSHYDHLDYDYFFNGKNCDETLNGKPPVFGCVPKNEMNTANTEITLNRNGLDANGKSKVPLLNGHFGAQSFEGRELAGSAFDFFRDNKSHKIRVDVWGVGSNDSNVIKNTLANSGKTLVTLAANGTPNTDMLEFQDKNMHVIRKGSKISLDNRIILPGQENVFHWKSSWASDRDKPHQMNLTYTYKPQIRATVPTEVNQAAVTGTGQRQDAIDVFCDVHFDKDSAQKSKTKNRPKEIDINNDSEYGAEMSSDVDHSRSLKISFAKSSSE